MTANTALCILTPVGTPSTGTLFPTASNMSRAVPSPPQKTSKSTPAVNIVFAMFWVSSEEVCLLHSPTVSKGKPHFLASSSPMLPDPTIKRKSSASANSARNVSARREAMGLAPSEMAFCRVCLPSVPFNPTAPPIPATGLTMNPTVFVGREFWGEVINNQFVLIAAIKPLFSMLKNTNSMWISAHFFSW